MRSLSSTGSRVIECTSIDEDEVAIVEKREERREKREERCVGHPSHIRDLEHHWKTKLGQGQ
jgi:hypothetical protein